MAEYKKSEFSGLLFKVHEVEKHLDPLLAFPELKDYEEFVNGLQGVNYGSQLFRYIVYTYDRKSPYVRDFDNIIQRKKETAKDAGFNHTAGKFTGKFLEIMDCTNFETNRMIVRYCRMQSAKWSLLVSGQESFYNSIQELITSPSVSPSSVSPLDDSTKAAQGKMKLFEQSEKMLDKLEKLRRQIFVDDTNKNLAEQVYALIEEEISQYKLSPESRAPVNEEDEE